MSYGDTGNGGWGFDGGGAPSAVSSGQVESAPANNTFGGGSILDWLKLGSSVYAGTRKGSFKRIPQTPEEKAAYAAALQRMQNLPDANAAVYPLAFAGASSSPSLDMDALRAGKAGAYKAPYAMSTSDLTDILQQNKAANSALATKGGPAGATTGGAVPPPPPYTPKTGDATKESEYKSMGTGALAGSKWGPVGVLGGAIAGGIGGIIKHKKANKQYQHDSDANYKAWAGQYGSQFTDANGNPVAVPKNMDEYKKWHLARYGKEYLGDQQTPDQVGTPVGPGAAPPHVNIADTTMDWWMKNHYQPQGQPSPPPTGGA